MITSNSLNGVQLTYLALDCFHSIGIEALLTFATELLEVHLKKKGKFCYFRDLFKVFCTGT